MAKDIGYLDQEDGSGEQWIQPLPPAIPGESRQCPRQVVTVKKQGDRHSEDGPDHPVEQASFVRHQSTEQAPQEKRFSHDLDNPCEYSL
jgi:hypothetical protein